MDRQNRVGSKPGAGAPASASDANVDRRERLRRLALETIDLAKDPYLMKNHVGTYECKLCLTIHTTEGSYLAHTQAKKHQANLARRAAKEAMNASLSVQSSALPNRPISTIPKRHVIKIGRPGYKVAKLFDAETHQPGLLFQIHYPQISQNASPHYRFMSAFEQKIETVDRSVQYVLMAAEPYETIAFKIPNWEVDLKREDTGVWSHWDSDTSIYTVQLLFQTPQQATHYTGSSKG